MTTVLNHIIEKLEAAKKAATLETSSFGFPDDRIEIKILFVDDDRRGHTGDVLHPDQYVKRLVELHHKTWIINPIESAIELLRLHADLLRDSEKLVLALSNLDIPAIISRAKAGIEG